MNRQMITRMHICCFENPNGFGLERDLQKYPDRLCVLDEEKDIVIDVETGHKYTYIRTFSMIYFLNEIERKKVELGKRFACFKYDNALLNISSDELKKCKEIINLLKSGYEFPDGNKELTNEQYLELINTQKIEEEPKKIVKTRKKRK